MARMAKPRADQTRLASETIIRSQVTQQVRSLPANDLLFITMHKGFPGTMPQHKVYMRYKFQIASKLA